MTTVDVIYNEDCLKTLSRLEDNSLDMVFTSPPYADRRKNSYGGVHESEYLKWFLPIAEEIKRCLKPTGSFFLNIKPHTHLGERVLYVYELVIALKKEVGFRFSDEFCWTKIGVCGRFNGRFKNAFEPIYHFTLEKGYTHNPYSVATKAKEVSIKRYKRKACGETTNGSGFAGMRKEITSDLALPSNHLHIPQKSNQHGLEKGHSAVFPVDLPTFFIKAFSNEGDIIYDPFIGSGTTAVAAYNNNRRYIGSDVKAEYCELSEKRIKQERDQKTIEN